MKKYIPAGTVPALCLLLFFCWAAWEGNVLHSKYPDPQIRTYPYGETLLSGSYQITFSGWQWGNESLVKAEFPGFVLAWAGKDGREEDVRVGMVGLTITKASDDGDILDLSDMGFSSGAWGNQFDLELFYLLNPGLKDMVLDLAVGEVQQVTLPLTVLESQFTAAQWADIDSREFYVNVQYYPEHIRFLCPCGQAVAGGQRYAGGIFSPNESYVVWYMDFGSKFNVTVQTGPELLRECTQNAKRMRFGARKSRKIA